MNFQEIKELIQIINETEISELNLESDGVKVCIKKGLVVGGAPVTIQSSGQATAGMPTTVIANVQQVQQTENIVKPANPNLLPITSPMVGTFYSAASPDSPAYVEIGTTIKNGQAVCIIEAMKLMNEIEAEVSGRVVEILVENGQPVEFGQTLFLLEK